MVSTCVGCQSLRLPNCFLKILRKDNPSQEDIDWCHEAQYLSKSSIATRKEIHHLSTLLVNAKTKKGADHITHLIQEEPNNL